MHAAPLGQRLPQEPQLEVLEDVSTHDEPHAVCPAGQ